MKNLTHFFIFTILFFCATNISAQDYSDYLERAKQRLREGNCAKAQENYDLWKNFTKKTDSSIESDITECNRLAREKEQQRQQAERERSAREKQQSQTTPTNRGEREERKETPPPPAKTPKVFTAFGIKGGLNLSTIINNTTDIDFSPKIKASFHAGILLDMRFGGKTGLWGLQPELLYSYQGFVNNGSAVNFHYITIPLMAKLNFGYSSVGYFNFELGPYFSYLIATAPNSMVIITEEHDFFSKAVDVNLADLKNGTDIGVAVGFGYDFNFGLTIGARYNQGLSNMAKNLQWKSSVTAISLGFKF